MQETAVRKGYAQANFVKVIFERDEDDKAIVSFEMSLPLTEEHEKWVPDEIGTAWKVVKAHGYKVQDIEVEAQVAELLIAPDAKDGSLKVDTDVDQVRISVITEKGTGEERDITRLQFRLKTDLDNESGRFARVHFGHPVWVKLQPIQRKLIK